MTFAKAVENDKTVKRLNKINDSIKARVNVPELIKEMKNMLLTRKYRNFDRTILTEAVPNIADWSGEVSSHHARLADVQVMVTDDKMRLEELIKAAGKHLTSEYKDALKTLKTVNARKAEIDSLLNGPIEMLSKLERVLKIANIVDKELERSHVSSVLMKNLLEISTRPDRS